MSKRKIKDILHFRKDLPPFLVHLTRKYKEKDAKDNLLCILKEKKLKQSGEHVSSIRFLIDSSTRKNWDNEKEKNFFSALSVTETPLDSIHCLIDIEGRQVNLEPYGIVFLKERLKTQNFHPVLYFNNSNRGDADLILNAIGTLATSFSDKAELFFPLLTTFGYLVGSSKPNGGWHDFYWEREWRRPFCYGDFSFSFSEDPKNNDVFCGLCPEGEINFFEARYHNIPFIDPMRPLSWYAQKLIARRKLLGLDHSVV